MRVWVPIDNLRDLVEALAKSVGYSFDDADWDAIQHCVSLTRTGEGTWWDYPFIGATSVAIRVSQQSGGNRVDVDCNTPIAIDDDMAALAVVLQYYDRDAPDLGLTPLVESEFGREKYPGHHRLMEHLAVRSEHQEARTTFKGVRWQDHARTDVPWGYADATFLTDEARRYFLPAYMLKTLETRHADLLEWYLDLGIAGMADWSPLQKRLVAFNLDRCRPV